MIDGERGASLIETLVGLFLLGIALTGVLPAFVTQLGVNGRNEVRGGAVLAAQQVLDITRLQDPATLPTSGVSAPLLVRVGGRDYSVVNHYCETPAYCGANMRHVRLEVRLAGQEVFDVQTVYTTMR